MLLLFARRGRAIDRFEDLKGASVGIGPDGSGTAYLMGQLLENSDLKGLDRSCFDHNPGSGGDGSRRSTRSRRLRHGRQRGDDPHAGEKHTTSRSSLPPTSKAWWRETSGSSLGKIPAGFYDVAKPIPATDKLVAQVDTLIMTNACVHRAERVAFLRLLTEEFPTFVRDNPPPAAKSQDQAPLADEAREFFTNGGPALADHIFPGS